MEVQFSREKSDIAKQILDLRPRILTHQAQFVVESAFRHGAYVAGGFARVALLDDDLQTEDAWDRIQRYLRSGDEIDKNNPYWRCGRGDIDLFFPNVESLHNFTREVSNKKCYTNFSRTVSGSAYELLCDNRIAIQPIISFTGPIEDLLSNFDIYNAMVAFNDKEAIIPSGWRELEKEKVLHVANWTSPYVVHRIAKWRFKHQLVRLSPKTAVELGKNAIELMARLKKEPIEMPWGLITHEAIISKLRYYLPQLTNDDLVLLCSVYPLDAYHSAFSVLRNRMEKAHPGRQEPKKERSLDDAFADLLSED